MEVCNQISLVDNHNLSRRVLAEDQLFLNVRIHQLQICQVLMVPVNLRTGINSMGHISSICHCIARKIDISTCIQNICNHTRKFRIILEIIGYISNKLLEIQETETGTTREQIDGIVKSEDYLKVCSKRKNHRKSQHRFHSRKLYYLNKTLAFCQLRKVSHESVFKYFNQLNKPKYCELRKNIKHIDVKTKLNTVIPKLRKMSEHGIKTKSSSANSVLSKLWSIWLCLMVYVHIIIGVLFSY